MPANTETPNQENINNLLQKAAKLNDQPIKFNPKHSSETNSTVLWISILFTLGIYTVIKDIQQDSHIHKIAFASLLLLIYLTKYKSHQNNEVYVHNDISKIQDQKSVLLTKPWDTEAIPEKTDKDDEEILSPFISPIIKTHKARASSLLFKSRKLQESANSFLDKSKALKNKYS